MRFAALCSALSARKLPSAQNIIDNMTKLKDLRAKGAQMHKDGQPARSMVAMAEGKRPLGVCVVVSAQRQAGLA